jgi:hypothetical protein
MNFDSGMPPCHVQPFIQPGVVIAMPRAPADSPPEESAVETCDYCASSRLEWRKCKLVCANCHQINKSCADL